MGDLLEKHAEKAKALEGSPSSKRQPIPSKTARARQPARQASAATTGTTAPAKGGAKRRRYDRFPCTRSAWMNCHLTCLSISNMELSDKENAGVHKATSPELSNPKRRNNGNPTIGTSRTVSQFVDARILSPKSSNSRTFPQSPLKVSPLKPSSQAKAAATNTMAGKSTRTKGGRNTGQSITQENSDLDVGPTNKTTKTKKAAGRPAGTATAKKSDAPSRPATRQRHGRQLSTSTVASNASAGTTVVRPARGPTASKKTSTAPSSTVGKKASAAKGSTSTAKKATAAANRKAQPIDQPAPGRRVLRNRG